MSPRWHTALGFALTGSELPLDAADPAGARPQPDPEELVADLAGHGWSRDRITEHARTRLAADLPWPHQVPSALKQGCGAAQFHAALGATRVLLDVVALERRPPSRRTQLNRDEQRLMQEVPPHHGS
ncbi:MAG: hypothetical protein WAL91_12270 [Propionicimonas sp.]